MKLNAVVVRGMNDGDVTEMARLTLDHPWQVRFIEMMPFAGSTELQKAQVVKNTEMKAQIEKTFGSLVEVDP